MRCRHFLCLVAFAGVLLPVSAHADVGTPLVWGSAIHLLVGNAVIGACEGWLLWRYLGQAAPRRLSPLIAGNYLSAWIGTWVMPFLFEQLATDIYAVGRAMAALVVISFLLTLLVEWPFVYKVIPKGQHLLRQSLRGNLVIQTASYVLLFGGYFALSGTSLLTRFDRVPPGRLELPAGVQVFYVSEGDGFVYGFTAGDRVDERISDLRSTNDWDYLGLRDSATDTNAWDLVLVSDRKQEDAPIVLHSVATEDRISAVSVSFMNAYHGWAHWPDIGMWARRGNERVRLALGTPFGGWSPLRVVHLPGDLAVLQLGNSQVCLVDITTRRISLLRRGYGFVALPADVPSIAAEARLRCGNQLSSICMAARFWAGDNGGTLPAEVSVFAPEFGAPGMLICPSDREREPAKSWKTWAETNSSYAIVAPGIPETDTNTVYMRCLRCGTVGFGDGSVNDGSGRRRKSP